MKWTILSYGASIALTCAIRTLRSMLKPEGVLTVVWNGSCQTQRSTPAQVHTEKGRAAEDLLPRDISHVLWDYAAAHRSIVNRLTSKEFTVWAAPGEAYGR